MCVRMNYCCSHIKTDKFISFIRSLCGVMRVQQRRHELKKKTKHSDFAVSVPLSLSTFMCCAGSVLRRTLLYMYKVFMCKCMRCMVNVLV